MWINAFVMFFSMLIPLIICVRSDKKGATVLFSAVALGALGGWSLANFISLLAYKPAAAAGGGDNAPPAGDEEGN